MGKCGALNISKCSLVSLAEVEVKTDIRSVMQLIRRYMSTIARVEN